MQARRGSQAPIADVCWVLEGTYPFVQGGVSSWVHNLISALPDTTFHLLSIWATPDDTYERKYELPPNVVGLDQIFLLDFREEKMHTKGRTHGKKDAAWDLLTRFHEDLLSTNQVPLFPDIVEAIGHPGTRALSMDDLFFSERSWQFIRERYDMKGNNASYIDFFWTWRVTHLPIYQMLQAELPDAKVYHTASTGYAGFLASVAKRRMNRPMIVTEHGIYTHERKIEIALAQWIYVKHAEDYKIRRTQSFFKQWWINLFRLLSHICYQEADRIITITQVNQPFQLEDGADPAKMSVVPNGIRLERYAPARDSQRPTDEFVVGFVGRVVPIKDVKTFIRAVKATLATVPNLKAYVIGPTDEDPEYFAECQRLAELLDLGEHLVFTGRANVVDYYKQMHVLVLTSISEAQPLVILEGHCAGVPVVATNVGACEELLYGRTPADRALGPSGIVTAVASPQETADALATLARNPAVREAMVQAGIERVERFYREEDLNRYYLDLYKTLAAEAGV